jgi:hypothetical protein
MRRIWTAIILSLGGCNAGGLALPRGDDGTGLVIPMQGMYRVEAKAVEDTCRPPLFAGDAGLLPISSEPQRGFLHLFYPENGTVIGGPEGGPVFAGVDLLLANGFSATWTDTVKECGTAKRRGELQTLSSDDTHLELDVIEDFQTEAPCADPTQGLPPVETCRSDRLITYTLVEPCSAEPQPADGGAWSCGD